MAIITRILLACLAVGASVEAVPHRVRSTDDVLSGITTISNQLETLTSSLQSFGGGFNGTLDALKIQFETSDLINDVKAAAAATNKTSPFNEQDSVTITKDVVTLQTSIYNTLDLLVSKKPAFDNAILGAASASFLVKADLEGLRKETSGLGAGIVTRLVDELQRLGPLITSDIDFHFARAIKAYT